MSSAPPLNVKVIYGASARGGRRRKAVRLHGRRGFGGGMILGLLSLLVAGGLCYATWWPADKFIYEALILRTPLDVDVDAAADMLFPGLSPNPSPAKPPIDNSVSSPSIVGEKARLVIGITAYSWLTLATIASCAVALAGGAMLGRKGGAAWRMGGIILSLGVMVALAWGGYAVWVQYGLQYPTTRLRVGMVGLTLLSALIGLAIGRGMRRLSRLAALLIILAAVGSAVGLYLGHLCGAIEPPQASILFLVLVFAMHSFWGWIMLFFGP